MDEIIYNALSSYYNVLEKTGYISGSYSKKLLLLTFYKDFVFHDYRGLLSREDYLLIERALNCLWGSSCLIPYPDYLKMGKLHLGEVTEMAQRIKTLEDEPVLKVMHSMDGQEDSDSDIMIVEEDEY
jgi:hypothetical protein